MPEDFPPQSDTTANNQPVIPLATGVIIPLAQSAEPTSSSTSGNPWDEAVEPTPQARSKQPFQFSLARIHIIMVVLCLASAGMGALIQVSLGQDEFLMVSLALLIVPSGLLIVLGLFQGVRELYRSYHREQQLWSKSTTKQKRLDE